VKHAFSPEAERDLEEVAARAQAWRRAQARAKARAAAAAVWRSVFGDVLVVAVAIVAVYLILWGGR
jgi:hypothetical protein